MKIQLTEGDHVAACRIHARGTPHYYLAWAILGLAGYLTFNAGGEPSPLPFTGLLVMAASIGALLARALVVTLFVPWQARRLFRQTKGLAEPTEVSWDAEQISFRAASWSVTSPWSDFLKWREGADYYLLYINSVSFRLIPKREFVDDAVRSDFAKLMREKVKAS